MTMCMACGGRRHPVMPSCARQHPEATHCTCPAVPPPDRRLTLILAPNYTRARLWVQEHPMPRDRWHYVTEVQKLRAVEASAVRLVLIDGWRERTPYPGWVDLARRVAELEIRGAEVVRVD